MWRYGEDLRPTWTTSNESGDSDGHGGSGVGDVINFASKFICICLKYYTSCKAKYNQTDRLLMTRPCIH